jgi:hypothetical protein
MLDHRVDEPSLLLAGLPPDDLERAADALAGARTVELEAGEPHLPAAFRGGALLVVEAGFLVVRASAPVSVRSVVTVAAGPGAVLLPPGPEEALSALPAARVTVISAEASAKLIAVPAVARRLVEQLASAVAQRQEALANFAPTRHTERVRRRLLQLARAYGHVVGDGIRIDFPITHALLAEMVGSSRETVTRALDELHRDGFVARTGSTYRLLVSSTVLL